MRKGIAVSVFIVLVSFVFISLAQAQLINYDRRNRRPGAAPAATRRPAVRAKTVKPPSVALGTGTSAPGWKDIAPSAKSRLERQYDFNRDGKLQSSEVKQYLRYVIRQIERRGTYKYKSDFLTVYDKNGDGAISKAELTNLREDVLN